MYNIRCFLPYFELALSIFGFPSGMILAYLFFICPCQLYFRGRDGLISLLDGCGVYGGKEQNHVVHI
ncbi:hypothetical protein EJ08DRAFT_79267 [Tothia fuscella]|uniref:Uncharacterized protein n=1 Tax=Tothia fuscella TaxID=1048955 RepID=A0A9P4NXB8_9PEZI|nr:hypothetical protein EJ08DRAFT_79267 [Tothia fuscella]